MRYEIIAGEFARSDAITDRGPRNFNRVALVGDEVGDAIGAARERTEHERVCALATGQKVDVSAAFEPVGTFSANEAVGTGIAEHDVVPSWPEIVSLPDPPGYVVAFT